MCVNNLPKPNLKAGGRESQVHRHIATKPPTHEPVLLSRFFFNFENKTLVGIPAYLMRRLQSALNAAARLIFHLRRSDHITDALVSLHWLRVLGQIQFKIASLTYRVLHGNAPRYLGPLTSTVDVPGRRALCSAGTNRLVVPPVRLATVSSRAFPVAAAHTWNSLPKHNVSASTLQLFKRHLKTLLLQQSFRLAL